MIGLPSSYPDFASMERLAALVSGSFHATFCHKFTASYRVICDFVHIKLHLWSQRIG